MVFGFWELKRQKICNMKKEEKQKSEIAKKEEEILKFWEDNKIFEKSLKKKAPKGEFVFYDGPPFATGLPHYGNLLSSIIKDVIPRYKTMRGYSVRRRFGWDCHGLPIENMIEKQLGLKNKKEIEKIGINNFNKACRASVLAYANEWKKFIDRIGRWVEFDNSYKTMDVLYMESVWQAIKQIYNKNLLYEGKKVLMYCPRCETPLSKAEVAMDHSYRNITEDSITVKFKLKPNQKIGNFNTNDHISILAWTTTPWTLPANLALAVGEDIEYVKLENNLILAKDSLNIIKDDYKITSEFKGSTLVGLEYEPIYNITEADSSSKNSYFITKADFVNTEDGTGIVHIAPAYGEDDYAIGVKYDLPIIQLLDQSAHFNTQAPEFIRGQYYKKASKLIIEDLENRKILFDKKPNTHSYPHCHRCEAPLIYNTLSSWFINIQKIKDRLIQLNEKINWFPKNLKHGRFLKIVQGAPDWNISRNRYWASPLPIWKCGDCGKLEVIGSIDELKSKVKKSENRYFIMRHGEAENNILDIISSKADNPHHLTEKGKKQIIDALKDIKDKNINLIITSPFVRTRETAEIIADKIGIKKDKIIIEKQIQEIQTGDFNGKTIDEYHKYFNSLEECFKKECPGGGENYMEIKNRMGKFIYELETKYKNKNILIVTHEAPAMLLFSAALGYDAQKTTVFRGNKKYFIDNAEIKKLDFIPLPHNENYEIDLHLPYIDEIELICVCGEKLKRIPEVLDGWFESASMPFAEYHYPFENKEEFEKRFPGDFIAEYIAQTRTWFYYMHTIAAILFDDISFKNVITTGNILAEDGSKMSKSKGNYTDPIINLNIYGADALRYYLTTSVVMQAEDIKFTNNEIKEAQNKVINLLFNTVKFYDLYKDGRNEKISYKNSKNILDKWIIARINELIKEITENLEEYNIVKAGRPIKDFIDDLSTWYLRRSRDRFKGNEEKDKQNALATIRFVLLELSKLMAPFTPFIAEYVYQKVKDADGKESVHLENWMEKSSYKQEILNDMKEVRKIVSFGLENRANAGIKVRQPLASLKIKDEKLKMKDNLLQLIKDEVNVKEILFDKNIENEVEFNTALTKELEDEGAAREFIRVLQNARKEAGLMPRDFINLDIETDHSGKNFIENFAETIKTISFIKEINFIVVSGEEIKIVPYHFKFKIVKN